MNEILNYLQSQQTAMVQTLAQLVAIESPSRVPSAVNAVGEALTRSFEALGAQVERLPQTTYGHHLRATWGQGEGQVLLLAHMDTVWALGETERRPFHIDGDRATGPGVFDMKGGIVIGLYALQALRELGLTPAHRLVFMLNTDEEVGSPTSRPFIEREACKSEAVLVLEPSREEALVTWRKGVGRFVMEIQGVASHSGAAHEKGVSALEEMAHQILRLEALTDYGRGSTVNVGVVRGGAVVNARPDFAHAEIDLRVVSAQEATRLTDEILGSRPVNPKATVTVTGGMNRPPWEPSPQGDALFERARRVGQSLGMDLSPAGTGGGSDGNFTAALGIPTLDGLGCIGNDAHALTEWTDLTSLPTKAALLAGLLLDLGR